MTDKNETIVDEDELFHAKLVQAARVLRRAICEGETDKPVFVLIGAATGRPTRALVLSNAQTRPEAIRMMLYAISEMKNDEAFEHAARGHA